MEHPISPPPRLVEQWRDEALNSFPDDENPCPCDIDDARDEHIATQAARWGADQELEACCEWLNFYAAGAEAADLRTARRPRPTQDAFTKELALDACARALADGRLSDYEATAIRLALDAIRTPQD